MSREGTLFNDDDNPTGGEFNEYVNPGRDAVWSDAAIEITGLSRSDPKIASARSIIPVWGSFCSWIETNIADDEVGAIVAYNGAGCDMKWIWQLTQAPNSPCDMPEKLAFYVDPLKIIRKNMVSKYIACAAPTAASCWHSRFTQEGRKMLPRNLRLIYVRTCVPTLTF